MPEDFAVVAPTMVFRELVAHYHVGREALSRWLAEAPHISVKKRIKRPLPRHGKSSLRIADPLFQEIECHIPPWLAADIRADVISEIYVAILEGSMTVARLQAEGRKFIDKVIEAQGHSVWSKTISLDAQTADGHSLSDTIADDNAETAFARVLEEKAD